MTRIVTGILLLVLVGASIFLAPPWLFALLAALGISIDCWECFRMLERGGSSPLRWLGLVVAWGLVWSFTGLDPRLGVALPLVLLAVAGTTLPMWQRATPREMLETICGTAVPILLIALPLSHIVGLRYLPGGAGRQPLLLLFVCVIAGDTVAFYAGTTWGRRRLAPAISPKKSWEGALGGALASLGAALVARAVFYPELTVLHAVALGLVLGLAGILGDLAASLIKRSAGVKDSSHLLPGHGGLLDRTDSLLFSAPILYYYWMAWLQGAG